MRRTNPDNPYGALVKKLMGPLPSLYGTNAVQRLVGFFVIWHMFGGIEPMRKAGWAETTIWRARKDFRLAFGIEVEDAWPELAATARLMGGRSDAGE